MYTKNTFQLILESILYKSIFEFMYKYLITLPNLCMLYLAYHPYNL